MSLRTEHFTLKENDFFFFLNYTMFLYCNRETEENLKIAKHVKLRAVPLSQLSPSRERKEIDEKNKSTPRGS